MQKGELFLSLLFHFRYFHFQKQQSNTQKKENDRESMGCSIRETGREKRSRFIYATRTPTFMPLTNSRRKNERAVVSERDWAS